MTPQFKNTQADDVATLRRDVLQLTQQFGESAGSTLLGPQSVGTAETTIGHGLGFPCRWRAYDAQGPGVVYQTKPADSKYLYLKATVAVVVSVEVF